MSQASTCNGRDPFAQTGPDPYAQAALRGETDRVRMASEGDRNNALNRAAFSLGQLVAVGQLDADEVTDELTDAAREAGLTPGETRATIRSGLRGGARHPRTGEPVRPAPVVFGPRASLTPEQWWQAQLDQVDAALGLTPVSDAVPGSTSAPNGPAPSGAAVPSGMGLDGTVGLGSDASPLDHMRALTIRTKGLDDMAEPAPLVGRILFRDSLAWLFGAPGSYKSFIALDIAGCVGTGEPWQGEGATAQGPVLYVVAEGLSGLRVRVRAWESALGHEMDEVIFLPLAVQATNATMWNAFIALAVECGAVLIVLDTQARMSTGLEENSATEMGRFIERLEELRAATGACVLVIHHTGRGGDHLRGSIALDGAATTIIKVTRTENQVELECTKQKDETAFEPIRLRAVPHERSIIMSPIGSSGTSTVDGAAGRRLLAAWWDCFETQWESAKTITETTQTARATFFRQVKPLERAGFIETKGDGPARRFRLVRDPGVSQVSSQSHESREAGTSTVVESLTVSPPFRGETGETPRRVRDRPIEDGA